MKRRLSVTAGLVAILLLPLPAQCVAPAARDSAAATALFARAEASFTALRLNSRQQRQRRNFTSVLQAYRQVFEKFPASRQGEQSLMRAGELFTLLFRWTGREGDLNQAQNYYQRLVQTFPRSNLADDALLAIAYLYLDHFQDPAQAWLRFRDVTLLAPAGDKAAEAKRQLRRLAGYAAAAPAVISTPPPTSSAMPQASGSLLHKPQVPPPTSGSPPVLKRIRGIRHWSNPEYSRVVIDLDQKTNFYSNLLEDRSGSGLAPRLYIDLFASLVEERFCKPIVVDDGILHGIRAGQYTPDSVRVVLEIDGLSTYRVFPMQNPFRIIVDVTGGVPGVAPAAAGISRAAIPPPGPVPDTAIPEAETAAAKAVPPAASSSPTLGARLTLATPAPRYTPAPVPELMPLTVIAPAVTPHTPVSPAPPVSDAAAVTAAPATFSGTAVAPIMAPARAQVAGAKPVPGTPRSVGAPAPTGKPSLARQLGLGVRRVVIDAGHGAHDPGAIGVDGLQEKAVTLDLALRLRDILQAAGYETILTRDRDVYLPLEERTALANTARGDLFLSLHCNASDAGELSGVETYFLNLASNVRSMQTAARENSMAVANMSDLQQIVREIQNSKMDESSQFAARVQRSLYDTLHRKFPDVKNLGVKQAPFYVLIGARMPSVLVEVSFINHRQEGRRLADPAYRQLIAQALADGVKRYVRTVKTAALATPRRPTP